MAPLIEFFELAHVGDMVQQMVQAYFDKEMAASIDRTDFLNAVVREKKHFEPARGEFVRLDYLHVILYYCTFPA